MRVRWIMLFGLVGCGFSSGGPRSSGVCADEDGLREAIPPGVGELVITEIMAKPKQWSAVAAQWFEVVARTDLDLNGVRIERAGAGDMEPEVVSAQECIHLAAGSYAVFARSTDATLNGNVAAAAVFSFSLNPTGDPDVQVVHDGEIIDRVTWTDSTSGQALQLDPGKIDAVANDDPASFCDATMVYDAVGGNMGSPGAANSPCPPRVETGECIEGASVRPIAAPRAGQLVISEFLANASGSGSDGMQEWFEIANTGSAPFDLNGLTISGAKAKNVVAATACVSVPPGSFALFAHSTDPEINGALPQVDATFSFALANRHGSLSILDGTTVLDQIAWTTPTQGDGIASQLQPSHMNVVDNDLEAHFCIPDPASIYGPPGNIGTPRALNICAAPASEH